MKTNYTEIVSENYQNIWKEKMWSMRKEFADTWILVFDNFLEQDSLEKLQKESENLYSEAYRSSTSYNPFVEDDENTPSEVLRNIRFTTQKECVCYDQVPEKSILKQLYNGREFQEFLSQILWVPKVFPYADTLAGININYYNPGDSLEWHYDNCNFTITLLVKKPEEGGIYEYFPNQRYNAEGKEDYERVEKMIDGSILPQTVNLEEATLVIFRGTESLHRVTPVEKWQRVLVTFCYNPVAGISLSPRSRMTFFGRLN